jgi:hypothetical protein
VNPPSEIVGIEDFLRLLGVQRARLETLADSTSSLDIADILTELASLSEQLIVAEQELRSQTEELEATTARARQLVNQWEQVFAGADTAYVLTDLNGIVTNLNLAARSLLEEPPHRPTSIRPITTKFPIELRRHIRSLTLRAGTAHGAEPVRSVLVTGTGRRVPVNVRVSRICLEDGDTALWWQLLATPQPVSTIEPPTDPAAFQLAAWLAHAAQEMAGEPTPTELLDRAVHLTQASLPAAEAVGIAYQRPGHRFEIMAVTGPLARLADEIQYRLDEGPCVDAARVQHAVVTGDVITDPRWPRLAELIRETPVRSVLACYLTTPQGRAGALNLYSGVENAFDAGTQIVAEALAVHAGLALGAIEQENTLRQAMGTRETIGQAVGILVERYKVTPTQAFALLVRTSQHRNTKLRDVAARLIETGEDPPQGP